MQMFQAVEAGLETAWLRLYGVDVYNLVGYRCTTACCRVRAMFALPVSTTPSTSASACSVGKALPDLFLEQAKGICAALKSQMAASIQATNRLSLLDFTNALVMVRSARRPLPGLPGLSLPLTAAVPQSLQLGILARVWDGVQPHVMQQALSKYAKGVLLHAQASGYLGPPHLLLAGPAGIAHAMSVDPSIDYSLGDRLPYALSSAFTKGNALLQGAWAWCRMHAQIGPLASRIWARPPRQRTLPLSATPCRPAAAGLAALAGMHHQRRPQRSTPLGALARAGDCTAGAAHHRH